MMVEAATDTHTAPEIPSSGRPATLDSEQRNDDTEWLAQGSFITFAGSAAGRVLGVGTQITLARLLGPATFGLYAVGWALLRVTSIFTPLGLDNGVIHCATRYARTDDERFGKTLRVALALAVASAGFVGLLMCLAAPALAHHVFRKNDLLAIICLFAAAFPLAAGLRVASASTAVSHSLKYSVYAESLTQPAVNLGLIIVFYLIGWRLLGAVAATVISFGLAFLLAVYYEWQIFPRARPGKGHSSTPIARELLKFSLIAWVGSVFVNLVPWVDRLFVGAYLRPAEVGIYQAAAQTSATLGIIAGAVNAATAPRISLLHHTSQIERLHEFYKVATKWTVYASVPIVLVFCLAPGQVLAVLYGARYAAGARPLMILAIMWLIDALAGPVGMLLIFTARQRFFSVVAGCGLVACTVLNWTLAARLGAVGAAMATALANSAMMLGLVLLVRATVGVWPFDARWLKGLLAAGACVAALVLTGHMDAHRPLLNLLLRLLVSATVFVGSLLLLGLEREDREMIRFLKSQATNRLQASVRTRTSSLP